MPHLAIPVQTDPQQNASARTATMFSSKAPIYKFELEVATLCFKHDVTLKEDTEEASLSGFRHY